RSAAACVLLFLAPSVRSAERRTRADGLALYDCATCTSLGLSLVTASPSSTSTLVTDCLSWNAGRPDGSPGARRNTPAGALPGLARRPPTTASAARSAAAS